MTLRPRGGRGGRTIVLGVLWAASVWGGPEEATLAAQAPATRQAPPTPGSPALVPDRARLAAASPDLLARLRRDPFNYFRFLNAPWARRTCEAFAGDLPALPSVRLHGDAHVEQYAFTTDAEGLDDFDDSARGPSVVDLVRFLGSIDLAARVRGWRASEAVLFDRFLDGYRKGLADRRYLPPAPAVVRRLRSTDTRDKPTFLAWAESLMQPADAADLASLDAALQRLDRLERSVNPNLPAGYLRVKKAGWLRTGVGSALTVKGLMRVEGPGPSPDDDVILEGTQLSDLRGVPCVGIPTASEAFRVVSANEELGRIRHEILAVVPRLSAAVPESPVWWIRSWDPSYREVTLRDYASVGELAEVVHDAGAQLGARGISEVGASVEGQKRHLELDALAKLEPRIRSVAAQLASELVQEWAQFRASGTPDRGSPRPGIRP